jgi:hypothetical protein
MGNNTICTSDKNVVDFPNQKVNDWKVKYHVCKRRVSTATFFRKPERKNLQEELKVDVKFMFKFTLNRCNKRLWIGLICLRKEITC